MPTLEAGLRPQKFRDGSVEIDDSTVFIGNEDPVFNSVEQCLKKTALTRKSLDNGLQSLRVQTANATEDLVKKAGFGYCHCEFRTTFFV